MGEKRGKSEQPDARMYTHLQYSDNPVVSGNSETHYIRTLVECISPVNS